MIKRGAIHNLEEIAGFHVSWPDDSALQPGMTAVLRLKNEIRNLPYSLPGVLDSVDAVVVVDNGSDDGTAAMCEQTAADAGAADRLRVFTYPFDVSRCGPEHLATPPHSVHALSYFYNWSFSQVTTRYALKTDGDMVFSRQGQRMLRELAWRLEGAEGVIRVPRHNLFIDVKAKIAALDVAQRRVETHGFPNRSAYHFGKGSDWEILLGPSGVRSVTLPDFTCFELKWLDIDEFDHWSTRDFSTGRKTAGKEREFEVFRALADGDLPEGVVEVSIPDGATLMETLQCRPAAEWAEHLEVLATSS